MATIKIGVLALQGDFAEHLDSLRRLNGGAAAGGTGPSAVEGVEVRLPRDLAAVDALIIPGGESTTIGKLMVHYGLLAPLRARIAAGMPVFGTCAGTIMLAKDIGGLDQPLLGVMDIVVQRNAFGRQLQSFETDLPVPVLGEPPLRAIFIRAPAIRQVGAGVSVLARLADGTVVAARQGNLLAIVFHPELTGDTRMHSYFLSMVQANATLTYGRRGGG